jgi:hypothetical protein
MENGVSDIPIYKIYHIRSPDVTKPKPVDDLEGAAAESELSPEYNVIYVFYGDVEFMADEGRVVDINDEFLQQPDNPYFQRIFSDYELLLISEYGIKVVFLPERIYPDDSIETVKKKFLYLTRDKVALSYAELYFFCKQAKSITTQQAYDQITSNGKLELTAVRLQNYLLNIDNHSKCVNENAPDCKMTSAGKGSQYMKLGSPTDGRYTYTNIANLKLEQHKRIINVALGQSLNIASVHEYPYAANPFDAFNADPFLEIHATELVNTTNKMVLIDYGLFCDNIIYLVSAEDALLYARETELHKDTSSSSLQQTSGGGEFRKSIYESYIVSLYYPYLSTFQDDTTRTSLEKGSAEAAGETDLSTIHSYNTLMLHKPKLFEADKRIINEKFMRQTANIKLLHDIYEKRIPEHEHNYIDNGIRGIEFMIHPETPYNQSLDAIFKLIHCSATIPYIKYNQGKKRDNIYKLFISGISRSGRKIPHLSKGDIFRLIKTTARKKSVAIYVIYIYKNNEVPDHKAINLQIPVSCEFYPNGSIYVKLTAKFSFTTTEIEQIVIATVNPILREIKEHVEQGGFQMNLFSRLYHPQIEIINLEHFAQLPITRNIEIKQMIKCISSAFNEVEGSLKKGIVLRYKRVSNYNDMSSQDAYIIEMMNKRQSDRDIIDGLRDNYGISEQDARSKLSSFLSSLQTQQVSRFRGGAIRIKNNPGFLTKITKGAFNNIITIEITNINNILYLTSLHAYIDSIIRIYQNPSSTRVPYEKISELCANTAMTATATANDVKSKPSRASAAKSPQPVVGEIVASDKEESIELMAEIVPMIKKPGPVITGGPAAAPEPIFGFEVEKAAPQKDDEIDLFDLLQDEDEDNDYNDDSAQNGGGGSAVVYTAASRRISEPEAEPEEEDLSDITGMELANPNPFSKRIQERDPVIHLNEDVGKFNAYSRSCPWNVRRQPVILTSEEKERIDREHPGSYSHSITYGSDASKPYHYICPRYWSLKHNTSLTEEEVKSGKYGTVIPQKAKKIPPGATIFEFTDDKYHVDEKGNYKQHYPGFLKKDAHPKGLCVPCCFAQWDKPAQTARRQECQAKQFEAIKITEAPKQQENIEKGAVVPAVADTAATAAATAATDVMPLDLAVSRPLDETPRPQAPVQVVSLPSDPVKLHEMKDDRILSSDKFPLENNRLGYLPTQLQKFLFTDNQNCQVSLKNASIKKDTPCLLRRGVETNDRQSFVSVIAYYYKESVTKEKESFTLATTVPTAPATAATATVKSNPPKLEPASITADSTHNGILKQVTDKMKNPKVVSNSVASAGGGLPISEYEAPATATATAATAATAMPPFTPRPMEYYASDDDTPIGLTQRPTTSAPIIKSSRGESSKNKSDYVPSIREMRKIIIQSLDVYMFRTLHNGTLVDSFYNPNKELLEEDITRKYGISQTLPKETFARICNAYENFIAYLDDDTSIIDHTYLWDIVCRPNERLFNQGNNIILLHIPDDDITNNVQVICPTNAYSGEVFDINRKTMIIMKRDTYYEPIYLCESKSNGKFTKHGLFSLKSKTLMPKIKHIIETVRDIYFSYCRLYASQPREYKYRMNLPASTIAKIVKEAGFTIHAQVMNYNGKVIGLQISQTISKLIKLDPLLVIKKHYERIYLKGVIPTAVSAPLEHDGGVASGSSLPNPPIILMDDEQLWQLSYRQTVNFLKDVQLHVKKTTKKELFCLPKVKVVEDGLVVGVITETNQFLQVNDPQQVNQNDEIPTITEGNYLNHLIADKVVQTTPSDKKADKTRERYVRNIRLETNFYNVFRNTSRNVLNRPENKAIKENIEKLIGSSFVIYTNKLTQIIAYMKKLLSKHVSFIRYTKDSLKHVGEVSGCITSDDDTCGKKSYCLKEFGGMCKLLLPQRNLMFPDIDNEVAYYGKLADEMIRYERVRLFMFEPMKYPTFQEIKYDLRENEIILLETFITQEYFENMEPADANPYIHQTNFYTVAPSDAGSRGIQNYDPVYRKEYVDQYFELETGVKRAPNKVKPNTNENGEAVSTHENAASGGIDENPQLPDSVLHLNEINHVLNFCQEVSKRKMTDTFRKTFFPKINTFEILFSNESKECSFDIILTILRSVAQLASKCPSGHSCIRKSGDVMVRGVAAAAAEPEICVKCQSNIGIDQADFSCRLCNYFMCDNCRFQHVDQFANITITRVKEILVTEYAKLAALGLEKKLTMILNGYGMKKYADIINDGRATLSQIIQSENYFLTKIDVWLLATYFKIPMVFVSQTLLSENGKKYMVLYGDEMTESYFFIQPFQVVQDVPSLFGLFEIKPDKNTSILKIPLSYVSQELQENIRTDDDTRVSLEEYIRTFKLLNIKKKRRVFTMKNKEK